MTTAEFFGETYPSKFQMCDRCHGEGKHTNPSIDGNGLTREDFDDDPDFRESYLSGLYDIECLCCKGLRVVAIPDRARMTKAQRRQYDANLSDDYDDRAERMAEARYFQGADFRADDHRWS